MLIEGKDRRRTGGVWRHGESVQQRSLRMSFDSEKLMVLQSGYTVLLLDLR
jgi:hypothetical protein